MNIIGELHIYQVDGMEEYLPKQVYHGYYGQVKSFLDSMSSWLFPEADSIYFKNQQKQNMLKMFNIARNIALCDLRKNLVINKMNWYVQKIIELLAKDQCNYDGYCIFIEASVWLKYNDVEIEIRDCDDNIFWENYRDFNFKEYISEPNYLKRDYSNKLLAYICNLLELYGEYFERDSDRIHFNITMNGDKCCGGRGFIEWS